MARITGALVIASSAMLLSGCYFNSATGTYVARFTNGIEHLQLVQSSDHQVTGNVEVVLFDSTGKITTSSETVTGAMDGSAVNLTFKTDGWPSTTTTASGEFSMSGLHLTGDFNGGALSVVDFVRSSESEYQIELALVQKAANKAAINYQTAQERAAAARQLAEQQREVAAARISFLNQVTDNTARLRKFETQADDQLKKWPGAEHFINLITTDMESKLARERSLSGGNSQFARSQLAYAIGQDDYNMGLLHDQLQILRDTFNSNIIPLFQSAISARSTCIANNGNDMAASCKELDNEISEAEPKFKAVESGLDHLQSVYDAQHQKQQAIIADANASEN